jgi:P-type E1-E2 ATPase
LQKLADRVASRLLPVVALAAVIAAALAAADGLGVEDMLARLLAVVVITCPCALSLAVPVVTLLVEAQARSRGLLFRDPAVIEQAATVRHVVLDKTGTLTSGQPAVRALLPAPGYTPRQLLALAAAATFDSKHPLASGLAAAAGLVQAPPGEREVRAGSGVVWRSEQGIVLAGRASWLRERGVAVPEQDGGTEVCVASNGEFAGSVRFTEQLRPAAAPLVQALQAASLQVHVLSGDTAAACAAIGERLNLDPAHIHHGQSPEDKLEFIRALQRDAAVAFIGDGLNDGPALAAAQLGVAVGEATASARSAAALLLPDGLQGVLPALRLARRARRVMLQNLGWALAYNLLALPAAMLGWVHPAIAAAAMGLSSICLLINTLRLTSARRTRGVESGRPAGMGMSAG